MMPPGDQPKADPLTLLFDEIEMLTAQTRSLELSLKHAHAVTFEESEKFQQEFRARVNHLKAEFEANRAEHVRVGSAASRPDVQNEDLLRRLAAQETLIQHGHEESERRGAAIVALRGQLARLEATNSELQQNTALRIDQARQELKAQLTQLQAELTHKNEALKQLQTAMDESAQHARSLESERGELRRRLAELEASFRQATTAPERESQIFRQDAQAKIAALQSEISHKTALLTQNQSTIARLERELKASSQSSSGTEAGAQALLEAQAEIAQRDAEMVKLRAATEKQARVAADEIAHARATFSAELEGLRSEFKHQQNLPNAEQELRNRNRELQGRLAAKESVIESQDFHLRSSQAQLLTARDALDEKERSLAESLARITEQEQRFGAERDQWQSRSAETQLLIEQHCGEIERTKAELAAALARQRDFAQEQSATEERARSLSGQLDALTAQLTDRQAILSRQDEILRGNEAREAQLRAALGEAQDALAREQAATARLEQDLTAKIRELGLELERKDASLQDDVMASRAERDFKMQIDQLQTELQEKERMLEARGREIGILQARVESLSGQTARLEAAQTQALADASDESARSRQALQDEIAALQATAARQQIALEEQHAAQHATEQTLRAELETLQDRYATRQTVTEKQGAEIRQALEEANALRGRIADLESAAIQADESRAHAAQSDAVRINALERQLQSTNQTLAEREAALERAQGQLQDATARFEAAPHAFNGPDQSGDLRVAQDKIAELLDRLGQLEADRQALQENAAHELQQSRESFETRIGKLRMELASRESARAQDSSPENSQIAITRLEEGFRQQIEELHTQLAEQHTLLENRNEELIRVKAELDGLREHFGQLSSTPPAGEPIDTSASLELREEDAIDSLPPAFNGSGAPDTPEMRGADLVERRPVLASHHFTSLEARALSWNPQSEKESAFNGGRRWNIGLFKRRWKA